MKSRTKRTNSTIYPASTASAKIFTSHSLWPSKQLLSLFCQWASALKSAAAKTAASVTQQPQPSRATAKKQEQQQWAFPGGPSFSTSSLAWRGQTLHNYRQHIHRISGHFFSTWSFAGNADYPPSIKTLRIPSKFYTFTITQNTVYTLTPLYREASWNRTQRTPVPYDASNITERGKFSKIQP